MFGSLGLRHLLCLFQLSYRCAPAVISNITRVGVWELQFWESALCRGIPHLNLSPFLHCLELGSYLRTYPYRNQSSKQGNASNNLLKNHPLTRGGGSWEVIPAAERRTGNTTWGLCRCPAPGQRPTGQPLPSCVILSYGRSRCHHYTLVAKFVR